jgi:hypothetical protein
MPEYIACYAMYGETSGDDEMDSAYDEWSQREMDFHGWKGLHLVDVKENGFMKYHELHDFGVGSCDTSEFVFHVIA